MSSLCIGGGLGALDGAMCSMNCEGVVVHCAVGVGVQWACSDLLK